MKPSTVMVVDDDPDVREDLAFLIQHRGYDVVTADHGKAALEKLRSSEVPCIILLDLMMPVMDGWETQEQLRSDPRLSGIPVIVVSGISDLETAAASPQVVGHLEKPIDLPRLYEIVAQHCCKACARE